MTFRKAGGVGNVLLAVAHDGQVVRQIETDKPLGAPAVLARLAFVPWAGQYVSVIDLANGDEAARVTLREQTSRAWTQGGSLWFGELGFIRFDEHIQDASKGKATTVDLPTRELPGTPKLMPAGDHALPPTADATDKVHIYARPRGTESGAALEDEPLVRDVLPRGDGLRRGQGQARLGAPPGRRLRGRRGGRRAGSCCATSRARSWSWTPRTAAWWRRWTSASR